MKINDLFEEKAEKVIECGASEEFPAPTETEKKIAGLKQDRRKLFNDIRQYALKHKENPNNVSLDTVNFYRENCEQLEKIESQLSELGETIPHFWLTNEKEYNLLLNDIENKLFCQDFSTLKERKNYFIWAILGAEYGRIERRKLPSVSRQGEKKPELEYIPTFRNSLINTRFIDENTPYTDTQLPITPDQTAFLPAKEYISPLVKYPKHEKANKVRIVTTREITEFDRLIIEAVSALWNSGQYTFTAVDIERILNAKSARPQGKKSGINKSINGALYKLMTNFVRIRIHCEVNRNLKNNKFSQDDLNYFDRVCNRLPLEAVEAQINGQTTTIYKILAEPIIAHYSAIIGQTVTMPFSLMRVRKTSERDLTYYHYIVSRMLNKNFPTTDNKGYSRISLKTIYNDCRTSPFDKKFEELTKMEKSGFKKYMKLLLKFLGEDHIGGLSHRLYMDFYNKNSLENCGIMWKIVTREQAKISTPESLKITHPENIDPDQSTFSVEFLSIRPEGEADEAIRERAKNVYLEQANREYNKIPISQPNYKDETSEN